MTEGPAPFVLIMADRLGDGQPAGKLIAVVDDLDRLFDVARQVTDEVFGDGAYADLNADTTDPAALQAIRRWRAGGDDDAPMEGEVIEGSDPRLERRD